MQQTKYGKRATLGSRLSSPLSMNLAQLIRIMFNSLDYLTKKATFKQINPEIPIIQDIPDSEDPKVYDDNRQKLVEQLLVKAKQIEYLIDALPSTSKPKKQQPEGSVEGEYAESGRDEAELLAEDNDRELQQLEEEMQQVNEEYLDVLKTAELLYAELQDTIRKMLDEHHAHSTRLLQVA